MLTKDVVFEQHYKNRVDATIAAATEIATQQGVMSGIGIVMKCIQDFEDKKIVITNQGMLDYLKTIGIKKQ